MHEYDGVFGGDDGKTVGIGDVVEGFFGRDGLGDASAGDRFVRCVLISLVLVTLVSLVLVTLVSLVLVSLISLVLVTLISLVLILVVGEAGIVDAFGAARNCGE